MSVTFPIIPASDLRYRTKEILDQANEQPVVITQRGRAAAVVLGVEAYNDMARRLALLEDIRDEAVMVIAQSHLAQMDFEGAESLNRLYSERVGEGIGIPAVA